MCTLTPKLRWTVILCTIVLSIFLFQNVRRADGAEQFALTASPGRAVEGYQGGIRLVLNVSNAQVGPYTFTWTVTDPSGGSHSTNMNTVSTGGSWSQIESYPSSSFSGSSLNLTGTYSVNVGEVTPSVVASVRTTTFQIGLTDSSTYKRNSIVQMTAAGYVSGDNVTINLVRGITNVPGFPTWTSATSLGVVSYNWQTIPSTPLGTLNISFVGKNTLAKNPPDRQLFVMDPTNTTTSLLVVGSGTVIRSQTLNLAFNATYLNGQPVATGSGILQLTEPDLLTTHFVTATYNSTDHAFTAFYTTGLGSSTGLWTATLNANGFDDSYGNGGPVLPVSATFSVQTATLTISSDSFGSTYRDGAVIDIRSRVLTPAGSNLTRATVTATITSGGRTVTGPFSLAFDQVQQRWIGSYSVAPTDPSGSWVLTLSATDAFGNSGQSVSSFNVLTPSSGGQNLTGQLFGIPTWLWLVSILGIVGLGFAILIFKHRNVSHREVKLDLQAIHTKAEEVKNDDFLQSIKAQLKRRTDMMAAEKKAAEEKTASEKQ